MNFSESESLIVKRHAQPVFRELGVRHLKDYEPHERTWEALCADGAAISKRAQVCVDKITDDMPAERAREIEEAADVLIEISREIESEKDRRNQLGNRGPRPTSGSLSRPRYADGVAAGVHDHRADVRGQFRQVLSGEIEQRALSGSSNAAGGFSIPREIDDMLEAQLRDVSPIRQIAQVVRTSTSDFRKIIADTGTASGWTDEDTERGVTATPTMHSVEPPAGGLYAVPQVSNWLLSDSAFNLENFLRDEVAREFAYQEGAAFTIGDGVNKPKGFLDETMSIAGDDARAFGQLQNRVVASATAVTADELVDHYQLLRPAYRMNATWVMSSSTATSIRKLKDGDGNYLWAAGLQAGQPDTLLGRPVVLAEDMPSLATGNHAIVVGDFQRGYLVTDRIETMMIRDDVTLKGHTKFHFEKRVGGKILDSNALKVLTMA